MSARRRSLGVRLIRLGDTAFDVIGMRPLGIGVFAASAMLLVHIIGLSANAIRAEGVAVAKLVDHPSRVSSFVTRVFVQRGDRVDVGAPLVELSSHFLDQELVRIDLEIEQLINESKLAQARLLVDEERWVERSLRQRPNRPSLASPTMAYHAKQIEVMQTQRAALLENREALIVKAAFAGVVAEVTWLGASIAEGASVASLMPEFAEEIVAYVPARIDPTAIASSMPAYIVGAETRECRLPGRIRSRGAAVEQAPPQLNRFFRDPVHGMPVHISIPHECRLGNGQMLSLDFRNGAEG
jgi:hypothetical protein